jgi:hypothetical protein
MPYIPVVIGVIINSRTGPGDTTDLVLGGGLGGEYFINPMFSFAVEARLQGNVYDLSGAKAIGLQTATAIIVNVYF